MPSEDIPNKKSTFNRTGIYEIDLLLKGKVTTEDIKVDIDSGDYSSLIKYIKNNILNEFEPENYNFELFKIDSEGNGYLVISINNKPFYKIPIYDNIINTIYVIN